MNRALALSFLVFLGSAAIARADKSLDAKAQADVDAALAALRAAAPGQPRLDAAARVIELGPRAVDPLVARLWSSIQGGSTDEERRAVLASFGADIPDAKGNFKAPRRPPKGKVKEPEWLAELANNPGSEPAVLDSLETVTLLRALAKTQLEKSSDAILDFAFDPMGMTFRDECGRQLRAMSPYSLATLIRATQDKKRAEGAYRRYATYQLDRLDKSRPSYALEAASSDELEARMLDAIGDVKHPDAVEAVLDRTDSPSHTVRRAARRAWMAYVTGPPPPPAPKAKRKLPGGKMTDEELPLYLTYRELAFNELTRRLTALGDGTTPPDPKLDAEGLTKLYFDAIDQRRTALWDDEMKAAADLAAQGKWDEVARRYDAILVDDPMFARRGEMVAGYHEAGQAAAARNDWDAAVELFHKAHSIDPDGPRAKESEGKLHWARAMRARAAGLSGDDDLARALEADPTLDVARDAASSQARARVHAEKGWMLYAGIASGVIALGLVIVAFARRRRS